MRINLIAVMLLTSLVLTFSGCSTKTVTVYVPQKCTIEKPERNIKETCGKIADDLGFMQCVARNYTMLEGDYSSLEAAFDGCK